MSTDIIENIVPIKRTWELMCLIIPVFVRWAKPGKTDMTLWIKQIEILETKMRKEKQPRYKLELHQELLKLKRIIR